MKKGTIKVSLAAGLALLTSACDTNNNNSQNTVQAEDVSAVIATGDWGSSVGAHSVVGLSSLDSPSNELQPTGVSDLHVVSYGSHFYRIERFFADNITKFSIDAPDTVIWQYSTMDQTDIDNSIVSSNPHDLVFVSETKAYLLRNGAATAWIVNPSASTEAEFKIGELDLSAYADSDGIPEMTRGVVVGNKLFIVMQRLESWVGTEAYVAVFDTDTDMEIDTGTSNSLAVPGLALPADQRNPMRMQYLENTGMIYIQNVGEWPPFSVYDGGVVSLDPDTYEFSVVLDDGDATTHPYGNISEAIIVAADVGYFVGYSAAFETTLYRFNPETGVVSDTVYTGLDGSNINHLALDPLGKVWIGDIYNQGMHIMDPATDTLSPDMINTVLNPFSTTFVVK